MPGSEIVDQVGQGLQQGAKGAKDPKGPKLTRRQTPPPKSPTLGGHGHRVRRQPQTLGDLVSGGLQAAGGITSTVGSGKLCHVQHSFRIPLTNFPGLEAAGPASGNVGGAGGIVSTIGEALSSMGAKSTGKLGPGALHLQG
jgi:hypothetical protein